jgi:hypothetical protein
MADYYTNKETRVNRHGLPTHYGYSEPDSKGRRTVVPKPDSSSALINPIMPIEDEEWAEARKANAESKFVSNVTLIYTELEDLLLSKHKDYGPSNISNAPGGALNGLRVRMHDKLARINNLVDNNTNPEHESLEDSFKDMANYAIIGLLVLRGKWDK